MRIPNTYIQDLLSRLDIVDIIGRYLTLKKRGQNYLACCPFHKENTPSFTVNPNKLCYHCFGCGAHGSVIGFIMEQENLSFVQAITKLAAWIGFPPPPLKESGEIEVSKTRPCLNVLEIACQFYQKTLKHSADVIQYLKDRGMAGTTAARFHLGAAPATWQALKAVFPDYARNDALLDVGLVIDHPNTQRRYDRFRSRVMFPILNAQGSVVGFGARSLGDEQPKYLNSPETPVFEKGTLLYGLSQAAPAIRQAKKVLVVEGYMDTVLLAQHGIEYVVATLGTSCTAIHVQKLLRIADELIFCFDGDPAGREAAWRALENSLESLTDGKTLAFLFLPEPHDPDSFVRAFGKEAFEHKLKTQAVPLIQYLLRHLTEQLDLGGEEGRAKLIHLATPLLARIRAPGVLLMLKKRIAQLCSLELDELNSVLSSPLSSTVHPFAQNRQARASAGIPKSVPWSQHPSGPVDRLLQLVLVHPLLLSKQAPVWQHWPSTPKTIVQLKHVLETLQKRPPTQTIYALLDEWRADGVSDTNLLQALHLGESIFLHWDTEALKVEYKALISLIEKELAKPALHQHRFDLERRSTERKLGEQEAREYLNLLTASRMAKHNT